jgi:hypothetical protein
VNILQRGACLLPWTKHSAAAGDQTEYASDNNFIMQLYPISKHHSHAQKQACLKGYCLVEITIKNYFIWLRTEAHLKQESEPPEGAAAGELTLLGGGCRGEGPAATGE